MSEVSQALNSILQTLEERDRIDLARRDVDDRRDAIAKTDRKELLDRLEGHDKRVTALETNWAAFFGDNGAFTYVKNKIEATDKQNRWIIVFVISTLVGVIVNLATKH